jgi:hypothetical protein
MADHTVKVSIQPELEFDATFLFSALYIIVEVSFTALAAFPEETPGNRVGGQATLAGAVLTGGYGNINAVKVDGFIFI